MNSNTHVLTENGWLEINALVGKKVKLTARDKMLTSENGFFLVKADMTYKVKTVEGYEIEACGTQQVFTPIGAKRIDALEVGDRLLTNSFTSLSRDFNGFNTEKENAFNRETVDDQIKSYYTSASSDIRIITTLAFEKHVKVEKQEESDNYQIIMGFVMHNEARATQNVLTAFGVLCTIEPIDVKKKQLALHDPQNETQCAMIKNNTLAVIKMKKCELVAYKLLSDFSNLCTTLNDDPMDREYEFVADPFYVIHSYCLCFKNKCADRLINNLEKPLFAFIPEDVRKDMLRCQYNKSCTEDNFVHVESIEKQMEPKDMYAIVMDSANSAKPFYVADGILCGQFE